MRLGDRHGGEDSSSGRGRAAAGGAPRLLALGVGAAKTGTHSLAAVLDDAFATRHELKPQAMIETILAYRAGQLDRAKVLKRVARMEAESGVEVSVSQFNGLLIEEMVELHPQALCLLTIRDARSWLKSMVNAILFEAFDAASEWTRLRDLRFDMARHPYEPGDEPLRRRGLYGLEACLSDWTQHNLRVIRTVAPGRLMVLPTHALDREIPRLAEALGAPVERLRPERSHSFARQHLESPVEELDPKWLDQRLKAHTDQLWGGARGCLAGIERDRMEEAIFGGV